MGGGDLNFKKSFHPLTFRNQERIWKEEHKAEEEQKKLEQLRKELEEERQLQSLQKLQEERGQRKRSERLDWMYASGPGGAPALQSAEKEAYLLGQRKVDPLLQQSKGEGIIEEEGALRGSTRDVAYLGNQNANTRRDMQAKIREDPLFAIKQREQSAIKSIASNPIKMRAWREEKGLERKDKGQERKGKGQRSEEDRDRDRSRRERYRHRKKEEGDRRSRVLTRPEGSRKRSRSPEGGFTERYHRSSRRTRSSDREERRHESRNSGSRHRDGREDRDDRDYSYPHKGDRKEERREGEDGQRDQEERERRLKAMMNNAKKADDDRARRLAKAEEEDRVQQELEEVARRRARLGDVDVGFIRQAQRSVYSSANASTADRIQQRAGNRAGRGYD
ncbi:MAG: Pre-mRNA splicing factor-domain-containing protein [Piptocephalis tieghemiana]|nr:MAG: Pre-mRNA splicing factor-domain-containing protein [Piptocephalis tieghemiana]